MSYLKHLPYRPKPDELTIAEAEYLLSHFEIAANEVVINQNQIINWRSIEEVEVAPAPRINGAAGWLLRFLAYNNVERYHIGIYYGPMEAVLTNVSLEVVKYVLRMIAYYVPQRVLYTGPDGLTLLED